MQTNDRRELLLNTHRKLFHAIWNQTSDPEQDLRNIMMPDITGFGTGKHETFYSCQGYIDVISKVFHKQVPTLMKVEFLDLQIHIVNGTAIVSSPVLVDYMSDGIENTLYQRRSTVYIWNEDRWRAVHSHVSEASAHLSKGESWPTEALKAHNEELKLQVNKRTEELSKSISQLKAAQAQLIQSEKMASLGELTAGIAHEIQNPLNFVNNFSEVSNELIDEMKEELKKGNYDDANEIADDIKQNLEKINHHGKRADAIVKGMLQHSRSSSAVNEPTDINVLADEYLRLCYHGLRAKDKSFNTTIKCDFDTSLEKINLNPQDIGRVILNLLTNAFYAVNEKKKQQSEHYEPTVSVSTKRWNDKVQISISDNGNGIPDAIKEKIFQPFFTTKPTGQGTGLGLSLAYDIVRAHGGEIKVDTNEGSGTTFIIQLTV
jgi:signal transduction histidine kinase